MLNNPSTSSGGQGFDKVSLTKNLSKNQLRFFYTIEKSSLFIAAKASPDYWAKGAFHSLLLIV